MPLLQSVGVGVDTALLGLAILLLAAIVALLLRVQRTLWSVQEADDGVDSDRLTAAVSRTFDDLGFHEKVNQIATQAETVADLHKDFDRMLRNPRERGGFGDQQLDVILGEHLPSEMYGIQEQVVDGKIPDAHVRTSAGLVCIDSKFPLDNYHNYAESSDDETATKYAREFAGDVEEQLADIANKYVRPADGTTEFAFAFIPSESVYYHLVTEEHDMLQEYTKNGVQVVSPLTFGHKLELIKAGVHARELSERADEMAKQLVRLRESFDEVEEMWDTLYRTHLHHTGNKAEELDSAYDQLREEFDRIDEPGFTETSGKTN